jgi:LmbE family N-acetylglucosaminyl deacetylase
LTQSDTWDSPQNILVILAHPDDPEFFCGGTLAKWAAEGHHITYVLLTCGDKGFHDTTPTDMISENLIALRKVEQQNAAFVIGAKAVHIMDNKDGYLVPDLNLRRDVVREIR